jgi:hypothetical protein
MSDFENSYYFSKIFLWKHVVPYALYQKDEDSMLLWNGSHQQDYMVS